MKFSCTPLSLVFSSKSILLQQLYKACSSSGSNNSKHSLCWAHSLTVWYFIAVCLVLTTSQMFFFLFSFIRLAFHIDSPFIQFWILIPSIFTRNTPHAYIHYTYTYGLYTVCAQTIGFNCIIERNIQLNWHRIIIIHILRWNIIASFHFVVWHRKHSKSRMTKEKV